MASKLYYWNCEKSRTSLRVTCWNDEMHVLRGNPQWQDSDFQRRARNSQRAEAFPGFVSQLAATRILDCIYTPDEHYSDNFLTTRIWHNEMQQLRFAVSRLVQSCPPFVHPFIVELSTLCPPLTRQFTALQAVR